MLPIFILLLPVIGLAFILRTSFGCRELISGPDAFYHLLVAEVSRSSRAKHIKENTPGKYFVGPSEQTYPPLLSTVLSLLLKVTSPTLILRFFSPVMDCLNLLLIYGFISVIYSEWIGLLVAILYAVIPVAVTNAFSLSPRQLAVFLFNLCIYSLWIAYSQGSILFFALAVVTLSLLIITHKSSTQVIFGVLLFMSVSFLNSSFPLYALGASLLSIISILFVFRKKYIKMVKDHIQFILNQPPGPFSLNVILANTPITFGLLFSILSLLKKLSSLNILNIELFLPEAGPFTEFSVFYLTGIVLFYSLSFLGRCNWYFIHASAPSCLLTALFTIEWVRPPFSYLLLVSIVIVSIFVDLRAAKNYKSNSIIISKPLLSIFQVLSSEKEACIMCIPSSYCYPVAYFTRKRVVYGNANSWAVLFSFQLSNAYSELEKGNVEPVKKILSNFHVTHIFVDMKNFREDISRNLSCKLVMEEGTYKLFSVSSDNYAV